MEMTMNPDLPELPFDPFAARAVGDPWRSPEPDVASINAKPFQGIIKLLGQIEKTQQVAALVLGEAGSGKTHLIKRLMREKELSLIFVYVHPMRDDRTMFSTLLERVITNLDCAPPGSHDPHSLSQLDHVVANVIVAALNDFAAAQPRKVNPRTLKAINEDPLKVFQFKKKSETWQKVLEKSEQFLASKLSVDRISKMVLKSLFQYMDESKKTLVRLFLSGFVPDEEEAKVLGLKFAEIDLTVAAQEERSKQILKAIGRLLSFYHPMILCFDQLENLNSAPLVQAFGQLISDIVNEADNILPVGFMRPDTLESSLFNKECDRAALDRLKSNRFILEGCNLEQAVEMVKARLAWAFDGAPLPQPHPFYPFHEGLLRKEILKDGNSPRLVLTKASKLLGTTFTTEDPVQIVADCFAAEREKLLAAARPEPFCKQTVLEALSLYFSNRTEASRYNISDVTTSPGVDLRLELTRTAADVSASNVDVQVETATHGKALIKVLNTLIERMESGTTHVSFFIRDASNPIPPGKGKMPKTAERLQAFESICGGMKRYIDYGQLVDLYALVYTKNKVPPGDLSYVTNGSGDRKTVALDSVHTFIRDHFRSPFLEDVEQRILTGRGTEEPPKKKIPEKQEKEIVVAVRKILDTPPFKFKLEHIAFSLKDRLPTSRLSLDQLAKIISQHSNVIGQIAVNPPIYYSK